MALAKRQLAGVQTDKALAFQLRPYPTRRLCSLTWLMCLFSYFSSPKVTWNSFFPSGFLSGFVVGFGLGVEHLSVTCGKRDCILGLGKWTGASRHG